MVTKSLAQNLTQEYGKGGSEKQLRHCLHFAETFSDREIVYALSRQLSWTHFRIIMYLNDELNTPPPHSRTIGQKQNGKT